MNKDHVIGFGVGLLAGAIIGGVVALLYAPKTGKETRQIIKDKAIEVLDAVKEKATDVIDSVKDAAPTLAGQGGRIRARQEGTGC